MHVFIEIPSGSQRISHLLLGENFWKFPEIFPPNVKFPENLQPYGILFDTREQSRGIKHFTSQMLFLSIQKTGMLPQFPKVDFLEVKLLFCLTG